MSVISSFAARTSLTGFGCKHRRSLLPKFGLSNLAPYCSMGDSEQESQTSGKLSPLQIIGTGRKSSVNKAAVRRLMKPELQEELQLRGLPVDGVVSVLRDRLNEHFKSELTNTAGDQHKSGGAPEPQSPAATQSQQSAADVQANSTKPSIAGLASNAQAQQGIHPSIQQPSNMLDPIARSNGHASSSQPATQTAAGQLQQAISPSRAEPTAPKLSVTWLGTSSGNPSLRRNVSCIALTLGQSTFLVDCGEGTSRQVLRTNIDPASIGSVFISHLHGDHCFGLPGVIELVSEAHRASQSAPQGRTLRIQGPPGIHQLVKGALSASKSQLHMRLLVTDFTLDRTQAKAATAVDPTGLISFARQAPDANSRPNTQQTPRRSRKSKPASLQAHNVPVVSGLVWTIACEAGVTVKAAQLQHRLPCWGYVFQEAASQGQLGRKVVLLGDTCDSDAIIEPGMGADLVSHEATFSAGMERKAHVAQHSTAPMAGAFARKIHAEALVLTHFSNRYSNRGEIQGEQLRAESEGDRQDVLQFLTKQAKEAYGSQRVWAADDFYTFQVRQRVSSKGGAQRHA